VQLNTADFQGGGIRRTGALQAHCCTVSAKTHMRRRFLITSAALALPSSLSVPRALAVSSACENALYAATISGNPNVQNAGLPHIVRYLLAAVRVGPSRATTWSGTQ
jgi:hypothetical protein